MTGLDDDRWDALLDAITDETLRGEIVDHVNAIWMRLSNKNTKIRHYRIAIKQLQTAHLLNRRHLTLLMRSQNDLLALTEKLRKENHALRNEMQQFKVPS